MDVITKISTFAKLSFVWALLFPFPTTINGQARLEFSEGKVWVKNVDKEVLYTFTRYYNKQSDWQSVFPVRVVIDQKDIPLTGHYEVFEEAVSFTPRFPFHSGMIYRASFLTDQLAKNYNEVYLPKVNDEHLLLEFSLAKQSEPSFVKKIYPTADTLPANLLKFHISFSTPMTVGEVYKRVKLLDKTNREVEKAFLIVDQEFWDAEMKVVTLLLDPGRIKRGLKANLEMDAPLRSGESYKLIVEREWKNSNGEFLDATFVKSFYCGEGDRTSPVKETCVLSMPKSDGDHLIFSFGEPMNLTTLNNSFKIIDSQGNELRGDVKLLRNEVGIAFKPSGPWSNERYTLMVNSLAEDLAGNNFNRVFDRDLNDAEPQKKELTWKFSLLRSR